jgi:hypothetical protein
MQNGEFPSRESLYLQETLPLLHITDLSTLNGGDLAAGHLEVVGNLDDSIVVALALT